MSFFIKSLSRCQGYCQLQRGERKRYYFPPLLGKKGARTVRFLRSTRGASDQNSNLRRLLAEIDAQWEALAYSIREDRHMLLATQQHWENVHLIFALAPEPRLRECPAIAAYLNTVEHKSQQIQHIILLKQAQLRELEYQFDQARLAVAIAQQETRAGQQTRYRVVKYFLMNALARLLRILWKIPHPSRKRYARLANDTPLNHPQQKSGNREKEPSQSN